MTNDEMMDFVSAPEVSSPPFPRTQVIFPSQSILVEPSEHPPGFIVSEEGVSAWGWGVSQESALADFLEARAEWVKG